MTDEIWGLNEFRISLGFLGWVFGWKIISQVEMEHKQKEEEEEEAGRRRVSGKDDCSVLDISDFKYSWVQSTNAKQEINI